ncbi:regulatory protein [Salana multivorans]|uniref:Regulatory protein RecX n=1 Tax=Salana multivorans TaxID=120377 RepID=A0A3N2D283_9MICO|nr:regulatory protein RecX [Salana multivorans]OJX95631.1 MAG: recombination regulator RecX [Micrococcales bacterium 73-15]ROR93877.1 regulatory protein [Salana multivorans]
MAGEEPASPGDRTGRTTDRGARRARRPRRAPGWVQEPPETGAAAVDAEPDPEQVARTIALRLLTSSPRSRHQLAEAMARKGVPEDVAERVLDRYQEVGLVDDAEYAAMLVRTRHTERGLARRALAQELARRGIDREVAERALEEIDRDDEDAAARDLVRRRAPSSAHLPHEVRVRRLVGMLARKGHAPGAAYRIVTEILGEEE